MIRLHLTRRWPFMRHASTEEARRLKKQVFAQRPRVDALVEELEQRRRENHFAEAIRAEFERTKYR